MNTRVASMVLSGSSGVSNKATEDVRTYMKDRVNKQQYDA